MSLIQQRIRFIDVTDLEIDSSLIISSFSFPKEVKNQVFVNSLYDNINLDRMKDFLTKFSGFYTRYYKSQTGVESNMWLFNELKKISEFANVTVELFKHDWGQHSIIAKFASKRDGPVTIVGAHQDSVNQWNPWYGRSPGADDDGSGTCGNVEAFRILVESGFQPETPLEFHFYAAEEGGLLGSQKIASDYKKRRVEVAGMFQVY